MGRRTDDRRDGRDSRRALAWRVGATALAVALGTSCAGCDGPSRDPTGDPSGPDPTGTEPASTATTTNGSGEGAGESAPNGTTQVPTRPAEVPTWTYRVVNTYPHDANAFTQGLVFHEGLLYESTGQVGESSLREVDLVTGQVLRQVDVPDVFCEGLEVVGDTLVQLTWQDEVGYVWDLETLERLDTFRIYGQGWGLARADDVLVMSNGSSRLMLLDLETHLPIEPRSVSLDGGPIRNLNELEWIDGYLYANVWQSDLIMKIDLATGHVVARVDMSGLIDLEPEPRYNPANVLNGIAWDADGRRLFVTGKDWPKLFEVELLTADGEPAPLGEPDGEDG